MSEPIVVAKQGAVRGTVVESAIGGTFIWFKGIPYALPPIGELRFKDPQPQSPWRGVRDATKNAPKCAQFDMISKKIEGQDDCLYLNVATKSLIESRPVMVWIHGGGFSAGHGGDDLYGPDYLLEQEIVFVSINYRLGVFGFLNLESESVAGNMGLKDQTMALRWIKENIASFGGDPNNVTIFGESAGGASVHLHCISPLSKGLFHKAIAQSGVAINPWVLSSKNLSYEIVSALGKETNDPEEALEFLREVPCQKLVEAQASVMLSQEFLGMEMFQLIGPTADSTSPIPFLPRHPRELVAAGIDIPFMLGSVDCEGIILVSDPFGRGIPKLDENYEVRVPREVIKNDPSKWLAASEEMKKFYFGEGPISDEHLDNYIQCIGDFYFTNGIYEVAEIQANNEKSSSTYLYSFSYRAKSNIARHLFNVHLNGTMHFEDIGYLFYSSAYPEFLPAEGTAERKISDCFVRTWTNFAKTGDPTPELDDVITKKWLPVGNGIINCFDIGPELKMTVNPHEKKTEVWKRIYHPI